MNLFSKRPWFDSHSAGTQVRNSRCTPQFVYASIVLRDCSNVMELSELINENDFDDEPPTLTPVLLQFSHWYLIQKPDQMLSRSLVHRND
ncbi:hypothetical protein EVAR_44502_1 [Eumeta japonica]|uniref:Uncharacterized protein n=1 Tax=Eumeta variegata TaxID=151549 RepID=A0A4C1WJ97_EUMVA|nr:hypothetical protein EVAR_44502_1 [Eumeta japonica]